MNNAMKFLNDNKKVHKKLQNNANNNDGEHPVIMIVNEYNINIVLSLLDLQRVWCDDQAGDVT